MAKDPSHTCIPKCPNMSFCHYRERPVNDPDEAVKPRSTLGCTVVPKKTDKAAARLLSGISAAFFASLERCSCINIATIDDADADGGNLPLIGGDMDADVRSTRDLMNGEDRADEDKKDDVAIRVKATDN